MVEYKNYRKLVCKYKVEAYGWPMRDDVSPMDPSSMGLGTFRKLLGKLESKRCSIKRLTDEEWLERKKKYNDDVSSGASTLPTHETQSDTGKKQKNGTDGNEAMTITGPPTKVSLSSSTTCHVPGVLN